MDENPYKSPVTEARRNHAKHAPSWLAIANVALLLACGLFCSVTLLSFFVVPILGLKILCIIPGSLAYGCYWLMEHLKSKRGPTPGKDADTPPRTE